MYMFPSEELKGQLLEMGICEVLIPLTSSPSSEVQGNSAAALGNLSSKGMTYLVLYTVPCSKDSVDGRTTFVKNPCRPGMVACPSSHVSVLGTAASWLELLTGSPGLNG